MLLVFNLSGLFFPMIVRSRTSSQHGRCCPELALCHVLRIHLTQADGVQPLAVIFAAASMTLTLVIMTVIPVMSCRAAPEDLCALVDSRGCG